MLQVEIALLKNSFPGIKGVYKPCDSGSVILVAAPAEPPIDIAATHKSID